MKKQSAPTPAPCPPLKLEITLPGRAAALFLAQCALMGETAEEGARKAVASYSVATLNGNHGEKMMEEIFAEPMPPDDSPAAVPKADPRKHVVTLELSPGAYASLVILKEYEGHASVEDAILDNAMRMGVQSLFQQVLGQEGDPTMAKWFGLPEDDEPES